MGIEVRHGSGSLGIIAAYMGGREESRRIRQQMIEQRRAQEAAFEHQAKMEQLRGERQAQAGELAFERRLEMGDIEGARREAAQVRAISAQIAGGERRATLDLRNRVIQEELRTGRRLDEAERAEMARDVRDDEEMARRGAEAEGDLARDKEMFEHKLSHKQRRQLESVNNSIAEVEQDDKLSPSERQDFVRQLKAKRRGIKPQPTPKEESPFPPGQGIGEKWTEDGTTYTRDDKGNLKVLVKPEQAGVSASVYFKAYNDTYNALSLGETPASPEVVQEHIRNMMAGWGALSEAQKAPEEGPDEGGPMGPPMVDERMEREREHLMFGPPQREAAPPMRTQPAAPQAPPPAAARPKASSAEKIAALPPQKQSRLQQVLPQIVAAHQAFKAGDKNWKRFIKDEEYSHFKTMKEILSRLYSRFPELKSR